MNHNVVALEPTGPAGLDSLPLCVDMDGTLLHIDTLHEAALATLFSGWRGAVRLAGSLTRGKAVLKREVAEHWDFDPSTLPYDRSLLDFLRRERATGRRIILCTASHRLVAEQVARHLGIFDEVIATDGTRNLRGPEKAAALCERFGEGGFIYAGNDATDHAVWDCAAAAVVVNAPAAVRRDAETRHRVLAVLGDDAGGRAWSLRAAVRALRPHQWVKNGLCLVPPIAAGDVSSMATWAGALTVALAFCLVASSIYIVNDISDLSADRAHPRKSRRPFASGELPVAAGLVLAPLLLLGGGILGWLSGTPETLAVYAACSLGYSARLKEMPLIDVFLLAGLYTIRLFGGGEASGHPVSLWLLGFSGFLFLSLALVKRVSELQRLLAARKGKAARRGYTVEDLIVLQMFGCASTFASAIVLSLYVQSDTAARVYGHPSMLWGCVPLLLFWQCRLWLSTARGYMHDDPIVYAARDWVSWTVFVCLAAVVGLAWPELS